MISASKGASSREEKIHLRSGESALERTIWVQVLPALVIIAGLAARLYKAAAYFLDPDEALHLVLAGQPWVGLAYKAALTNAHPPLLVLFLHYWRWLGQSEFVLRLPSVLAGTACCCIGYLWLKQLLESRPAFIGLLLLAFSPAFIGLSAEIRQYALLLFLISACLYLAERALRENSVVLMLLFSLSLCLALLIHYSALLFAFTMGIYMLVRFYGLRAEAQSISGPKGPIEKSKLDRSAEALRHPKAENEPKAENQPKSGNKEDSDDTQQLILSHAKTMQIFIVWVIGQIVALAVGAYFVFTHLIPLRRAGMLVPDYDTYLRKSIFHASDRSITGFVAVQTLRVFTYLFGHGLVGSLVLLAFVAGIVLLLWGKVSLRNDLRPRALGLLLGMGFVVNCAAGLARQYPYGGTRHSAWLLLFAVAGGCVGLAAWARAKFWLTSGVVVCSLVIANLFPAPAPLIRPKNQARALMKEAVDSFRQSAPAGSVVIADYQSGLLFGHYVCGHSVVQVFLPMKDFVSADCGGYTVITPSSRDFRFYGDNIDDRLRLIAAEYRLTRGSRAWLFDAGWISDSAPPLQLELAKSGCAAPKKFGENIFWCAIAIEGFPQGVKSGTNLKHQSSQRNAAKYAKEILVGMDGFRFLKYIQKRCAS